MPVKRETETHIVNGVSCTDESIAKKVEVYLSKGFDLKCAEHFAGGCKRIVAVSPKDDYTLLLSFDSGEARILDCKPLLAKGGVFAKFKNLADFRRVYLDEYHCVAWDIDPAVNSSVIWSNKVDLCPDACYLNSIPVPS